MNEELKQNICQEKRLSEELISIVSSLKDSSEKQKQFLEKSIFLILSQIELINQSNIILMKQMQRISDRKLANIPKYKLKKFSRISTESGNIFLDKKEKEQFIKLYKNQKISVKRAEIIDEKTNIKKISPFTSLASSMFYNIASSMSSSFKSVGNDLKLANMPYMLNAYISLILFYTFFGFIISLAIAVVVGIIITNIWVPIIVSLIIPFLIFVIGTIYPSLEAGSTEKKITEELPFAVSHMAAITSSRIEPSKVFLIMSHATEYPAISVEFKKISNQIHVFGYNLVNALKNSMKTIRNQRLKDLFNGISTTITTGGDLSIYLQEKSKDLLLEYKFERQRYSSIIAIYSDIYTALLIAGPLIFMLIISIVSVIGNSLIGIPITTLAIFGIAIIAILNILFLVFLHLTQPKL